MIKHEQNTGTLSQNLRHSMYFRQWNGGLKKGVFKNFANVAGRHPWRSLLLNKVAGPRTLEDPGPTAMSIRRLKNTDSLY